MIGRLHFSARGHRFRGALAALVGVAAASCGAEGVPGDIPGASGPPSLEAKQAPPAMASPVFIDEFSVTLQAKLHANDAGSGDSFGSSVALDGDTALIGAESDVGNALDSGSAFVFVRQNNIWTQQAKLLAIDGLQNDYFGKAVALSGDTALVGAWGDDDNGLLSGSAYVFVRSGGVWTEQAKLLPSDGAAGDRFGEVVALSGDTLLVGASRDDDDWLDSGSVYVFVRSGGVWTEQTKLLASDAGYVDEFGSAVALSGDTALIGAPEDDEFGSAYVFVRSGDVWTEQAKLLPSDGATNDQFGHAVTLSGDTALVGSWLDDDNGMDSGSAYTFVQSNGVWTEQAKLVPSDGMANAHFGIAVALSGDTALVGAPWDSDNGATAGSAHVFVRSDAGWVEEAKLFADVGEPMDAFGTSVAMAGSTALVGSWNEDYLGMSGAGATYVLIISQPLGSPCLGVAECTSGFCVDGVCCDAACGGGDPTDCQACSAAAGSAADGTCAPAATGTECRAAAGECDVAESCDGSATDCPVDGSAPDGTTCTGGVCAGGDCMAASGGAGGSGASSGSGGGSTGSSGPTGGGGGPGGGAEPGDEGGCACRAAGGASGDPIDAAAVAFGWLGLGLMAMRRSRSTRCGRGP